MLGRVFVYTLRKGPQLCYVNNKIQHTPYNRGHAHNRHTTKTIIQNEI